MKDPYPAQEQFFLPVTCILNQSRIYTGQCTLTDLLHINEATHDLVGVEHRSFALYD